ncbi:MAG TPA: glycosyltransferase [Mycobacteriales bacterium]|nr:glycosyltransferase [Mycobacteriales bacterium]
MSERLRVLHVLEALEGGTARHVRDLVAYATEVDHVVAVPELRHVGLTDTEAVAEMRAAGADVRLVDMRRSMFSAQNVAAVMAVRRIAREVRPDILHGHSSIGGVVARLVGRLTGIPAVWTPNGVLTGRLPVTVERVLSRWTALTIAVSPSEAQLMGSLGLSRTGRLEAVPNGLAPFEVDPAAIDIRATAGIPEGALVVGCLARLVEQKGIDTYLAMAKELLALRPDVYVLLIGSGPLEPLVRESVVALDRFRWLEGFNGGRSVLPQFTVFVLLSRYEGSPYTVMEAMSLGCCCVVTDVVGSRDLIVDGESGLLVAAADGPAVAQAIEGLLTDGDRRTALGAAASRRAAEHFTAAGMAARTMELYRAVTSVPG